MSFGSVSPLNPGDEGDNGTGGEARLINNATESADIVCVIAMGNDGSKRVPSPASAEWVLQYPLHQTVQLTGPTMESRVLPIMGPDSMMAMTTNGMSSNQIYRHMVLTLSQQLRRPGHLSLVLQDRCAYSDYDEKDGTSMATPIASGIVAG